MDRGAWWVIVHRVTKSQTQLKPPSTHACVCVCVCVCVCMLSPYKYSLLQGFFLIQGLNPGSLTLQADSLLSGPREKPYNFFLNDQLKEQIVYKRILIKFGRWPFTLLF